MLDYLSSDLISGFSSDIIKHFYNNHLLLEEIILLNSTSLQTLQITETKPISSHNAIKLTAILFLHGIYTCIVV